MAGRVLAVANAVAIGELRDEAALGRALDERVEAVEREEIGVERMLEAKRSVHGYLSGGLGVAARAECAISSSARTSGPPLRRSSPRWKPRSREDAIVATAESLLRFGIVGAAAR